MTQLVLLRTVYDVMKLASYVLAWELSNTLDSLFCIEGLNEALRKGHPAVFNTDQGSQFSAVAFTNILNDHNIQISMDGRGRAYDNIFIERLWRSVKYEEMYLHDYQDGFEAYQRLSQYFEFYNEERPHQALNYRTPVEMYSSGFGSEVKADYLEIVQ